MKYAFAIVALACSVGIVNADDPEPIPGFYTANGYTMELIVVDADTLELRCNGQTVTLKKEATPSGISWMSMIGQTPYIWLDGDWDFSVEAPGLQGSGGGNVAWTFNP